MSYPNPTNGVLYVEIDSETAHAMLSADARNNLTFDVRLYNNQGNLLRQQQTKGDTVEFNVQNLPIGVYYVHVYDGVNSTPEMQQVIVER